MESTTRGYGNSAVGEAEREQLRRWRVFRTLSSTPRDTILSVRGARARWYNGDPVWKHTLGDSRKNKALQSGPSDTPIHLSGRRESSSYGNPNAGSSTEPNASARYTGTLANESRANPNTDLHSATSHGDKHSNQQTLIYPINNPFAESFSHSYVNTYRHPKVDTHGVKHPDASSRGVSERNLRTSCRW